jgi:hypothetical protein
VPDLQTGDVEDTNFCDEDLYDAMLSRGDSEATIFYRLRKLEQLVRHLQS